MPWNLIHFHLHPILTTVSEWLPYVITHIFPRLRNGITSRAVFAEINSSFHIQPYSYIAANRSFLHFTITQLKIEYEESATETVEGSQKNPLAAARKTFHIRKQIFLLPPRKCSQLSDSF